MPSKLPRGITRTPFGYRAWIRVHGRAFSRRFPPDATVETMEAWRRHTRADAERRLLDVAPKTVFERDAARYLQAVRALTTYDERKRDIGLWIEEFRHRTLDEITPTDIRIVRDRWLTTGPRLVQVWKWNPILHRKARGWRAVEAPLSASTVALRMRALENLYTVLRGRNAYNPVREVPEPAETQQPPRALPLGVIRQVLAAIPECHAKRWLEVLAYTGIPPMSIARMSAAMIDLERGTCWVPGRRKGQGTPPRLLPLTPDGVEAWRRFIRDDCWRPTPPKGNMRQRWRLACAKVQRDCPIDLAGTRPYDLRHSVAALTHGLTGDVQATRQLLGVSLPTALRYAQAALDPRLELAVRRLSEAQAKEASESPSKVTT